QPSALLREHLVRSGLTVPIRLRNRIFGVLGAHSTRLREFTTADAHFLQVIANVLATAVERKLAEDALRESDERFRLLVEEVKGYAIITLDPGACVQTWNHGAEHLFGHSAAEMIGQPIARTYPPGDVELGKPELDLRLAEEMKAPGAPLGLGRVHQDDAPRLRAAWTALFERQQRFEVECRYQRKDGRTAWLLLRASAIYEKDGQLVADGITSDITERKRAEEALRESETQIRAQARLLDLAHDAIVVRNLKHEVLYWNRGAERIYGWTASEARGRRVTDLLLKDTKSFDAAQLELMEKGEWSGEIRQFTRDGREVIVSGRWTLVRDEQGRPTSVLVLNTDITEKKRLENQFLRSQRMESIGTLAGGVAHDLNNILSPIMMSAPLLRMDELPAEDFDRLLDTIETNAQRGSDIVKQL
ncbi:MAG: PAS domain S-box protein, partial [Verrucomicrobia bacterium]|nr:PAS domain S-box protein [Verrucomicrobiota bacterium]